MAELAYITIRGINTGFVPGFYPTQELANAAATDNTNVVAHVGQVDIEGKRIGKAYWDGSELLAGIPSATAFDALSATKRLRQRFREHHSWLLQQAEAGEVEGRAHDIEEVHALHNFWSFAHHASYEVAHDDDLTVAQKVRWAENQMLGPSNAGTIFAWYTAIRALTPVTGPVSACLWVVPGTGARVAVNLIVSTSHTYFAVEGGVVVSEATLADGGWIEELTA